MNLPDLKFPPINLYNYPNMSDYPEILSDLKQDIIQVANQEGVNEETAQAIAHIVTENMRKNWGGIQVYIGKGLKHDLSQRDLIIWGEFTGHNHRALCRKYDMSLQRLYAIIKAQGDKSLREHQGDLFG